MEKQGIPQSGPLIARIDQLMHTVEQLLMLARAGQDFASGHYQQFDWVNNVIQPLQEELGGIGRPAQAKTAMAIA